MELEKTDKVLKTLIKLFSSSVIVLAERGDDFAIIVDGSREFGRSKKRGFGKGKLVFGAAVGGTDYAPDGGRRKGRRGRMFNRTPVGRTRGGGKRSITICHVCFQWWRMGRMEGWGDGGMGKGRDAGFQANSNIPS